MQPANGLIYLDLNVMATEISPVPGRAIPLKVDSGATTDGHLHALLLEAQLRLLENRDFAIGAAARVGEMQTRLTTREIEVANALTLNHENNLHIQNHIAHIVRLEQALAGIAPRLQELTVRSVRLDDVYASTTWRIGRIMMLPIRLLRRILRRS